MTRAGVAGIETIVFGSGGSRKVPDGFSMATAYDQLADHLKRWGPIAGEHGVTIVVEPLGPECNICSTVDESADLVRRVDHPNIRLLADTYHMVRINDPADAIVRAGELIRHVHCAEVEGRSPIGTHGEDLTPYFAALKEVGFDGRVSIECAWSDQPVPGSGGAGGATGDA